MRLTVELKDTATPALAEVAICFDDEGLEAFVDLLLRLKGRRDHEHLMTPSWGGDQLTETKRGGDEYALVHHLRLVKT